MTYGLKRFQKAEALAGPAGGPLMDSDQTVRVSGVVPRSSQLYRDERVPDSPVASPEQYRWSSFGHYATGIRGVVEIESEWTARLRGPLIAIRPR